MGVYYHVKFQLCITRGSKVGRGVQNCTHPGIGCVQTNPPPLNRVTMDILREKTFKVQLGKFVNGFKLKGSLLS